METKLIDAKSMNRDKARGPAPKSGNAGEEQREEEIKKFKSIIAKLETIVPSPNDPLPKLAEDAAKFWKEGDNQLDDDLLQILEGQQRVMLLNYLVARSVNGTLNQDDDIVIRKSLVKKPVDSVDPAKVIADYVSKPDPQMTQQAVDVLAKANVKLRPMYSSAVVFDAMRNPVTKKLLLVSIGQLLATSEKPAVVGGDTSTVDPQRVVPQITGPQVVSTPFFTQQPNFVAVVRKVNGLQYATGVSDAYGSPVGGIHIDDGDVITLVLKEDLFPIIDETGVSTADIRNQVEKEFGHNVAVIKMLVMGRLTEVIVPLENAETSNWVPADAVVSLSNFGQVPVIASSRALMERRLRGEVDDLRNRTDEACRLLSENSRLGNRVQPIRDRIVASNETMAPAWNGWNIPAIFR